MIGTGLGIDGGRHRLALFDLHQLLAGLGIGHGDREIRAALKPPGNTPVQDPDLGHSPIHRRLCV